VGYHLSYSRTFPAGVAKTFDRVLPMALPELFARRYGPLPAIREVRDQVGVWGAGGVGSTRTIVLADGGTMRETLTELDRPRAFGYDISEITGPMKALARTLHGRWAFEPAGTGVRITWSWDVEPRNAVGARLERVFRRLWTGYARQAFEQIEDRLLS
jgi:Polyketide cyclase / dehydrase and lipid transport